MAISVAETCRRHTMYISFDETLYVFVGFIAILNINSRDLPQFLDCEMDWHVYIDSFNQTDFTDFSLNLSY